MNIQIKLFPLLLAFLAISSVQAFETTKPTSILVAQAPVSNPKKNAGNGDDDDFTQVEEKDKIVISDPLEKLNRGVFWFNDKFYFYLLKPVAKGYRAVVPEKARVSVSNFFSNLAAPIRIVNSALQLKGEDATNETVRFLVNTTIGVGGLFDVAKNDFKIQPIKEDFGQTLGHYGVGYGFYIVLPFWGPSTIRDSVGLLVDSTMDPIARNTDTEGYVGAKFVDVMNEVSLDKDTYEAIKKDSLDPYLFIRNAYIQNRKGLIKK